MIYSVCIDSPVGSVAVFSDGEYITEIAFEKCENIGKTNVLSNCVRQLKEYFDGERKEFCVPLKIEGSKFQKRVWNALCKIQYGTVISYKQLAEMSGSPNAYRAVGKANGKNRIPIIIPCHRVINENGEIGGYSSGI
ncbi:MAG: methylated-DNA--[protein]-cysteine S-methyltransferase [Firmicutes bacterium]|nr:methylated-DNA--[protein]-cysteine S-methyltransferase [Bacillota bacterium]